MERTLSSGPGAVAQLGERRLCTAEVRGSNPLGSTYGSVRFAGKFESRMSSLTADQALVQQPGSNADGILR
jgi:hypothetical protein